MRWRSAHMPGDLRGLCGLCFGREVLCQRLELELDTGKLLANAIVQILSDAPPLHFADAQYFFLQALVFGDVSTDGNVLLRFSVRVEIWIDGRRHPIKVAVFGTIANRPLPNLTVRNSRPKVFEEFLRVMAGVDDAMVLPDQFIPRIFGNLTEFVIHVSDPPARVCDGHDRMRVQSGLEVAQFAKDDSAIVHARSKRRIGLKRPEPLRQLLWLVMRKYFIAAPSYRRSFH